MTISKKQNLSTPKSFWTSARITLTSLTLALLISVASSCGRNVEVSSGNSNNAASTAANANQPESVVVRKDAGAGARVSTSGVLEPVPDATLRTELQKIDGKSFKLTDYAGDVVVLNLWATWCGPCRIEVPHFVELNKEYAPKGVKIIGLTTEDPEVDKESVQEFMKEYEINYDIGWANEDLISGIVKVNSIPQTFVITRDGHLQARFIGFSPSGTLPQLRAAIEKALSAPKKS